MRYTIKKTLYLSVTDHSHVLCARVCGQVCITFNPQSTLVATGSMDTTAKLWDVESGHEVSTLAVSICVAILFISTLS